MEDKEPTELTLEAVDDEKQTDSGPCGKAKFQVDSRSNKGGDRRLLKDRRSTIRFQVDRRSGADRRSSAEKWDNCHSF